MRSFKKSQRSDKWAGVWAWYLIQNPLDRNVINYLPHCNLTSIARCSTIILNSTYQNCQFGHCTRFFVLEGFVSEYVDMERSKSKMYSNLWFDSSRPRTSRRLIPSLPLSLGFVCSHERLVSDKPCDFSICTHISKQRVMRWHNNRVIVV